MTVDYDDEGQSFGVMISIHYLDELFTCNFNQFWGFFMNLLDLGLEAMIVGECFGRVDKNFNQVITNIFKLFDSGQMKQCVQGLKRLNFNWCHIIFVINCR